MAINLGILLFSFILAGVAMVPFIDLLYKFHFIYTENSSSPNPKFGTPIGGGILLIGLTTFLYSLLLPLLTRFGVYITTVFPIKEELNVIFFTFISFALVGLYDDLVKIFHLKRKNIYRLSIANKLVLQVVLSFISALLLYQNLHIHFIHIPFYGVIDVGWGFVLIAAGIIFAFSRSFDITDGMDGLACGILLISLLSFWAISLTALDTVLSVFIALWVGCLVAFLYFNVYPARIWLGNAGSLSFGSTLAVTGLLLGKPFALLFIGGIFILDGLSNLFQLISTTVFKRKIFPVAPFHYWLQAKGWPEPKVVQRLWLASMVLSLIGLWLAGV